MRVYVKFEVSLFIESFATNVTNESSVAFVGFHVIHEDRFGEELFLTLAAFVAGAPFTAFHAAPAN